MTAAAAPLPEQKNDALAFEAALAGGAQLPLRIQALGSLGPQEDVDAPLVGLGHPHLNGVEPKATIYGEPPWFSGMPVLKEGDWLKQYALGKLPIIALSNLTTATLFLVGPSLSSGQQWAPSRLSLEGQTYTLQMDCWTDDGPRRRNVPSRFAYALDLGELRAGPYEIQILWRDFFAETGQTAPMYRLRSLKTARLKFSVIRALVGVPGPGQEQAALVGVKEKDFQTREVPAGKSLWQRPICWQRPMDWNALRSGLPAAGLSVGSFNLAAWLPAKLTQAVNLPPLEAPSADKPAYAVILGPQLNTGEWLTLREVEWQDKRAVLRLDLWRDNEVRKQNQVGSPILVAPLGELVGRLAAGEFTVESQWSLLRAPTNRDPYLPEKPQGDAGKLLESLTQRGKQTFKVP